MLSSTSYKSVFTSNILIALVLTTIHSESTPLLIHSSFDYEKFTVLNKCDNSTHLTTNLTIITGEDNETLIHYRLIQKRPKCLEESPSSRITLASANMTNLTRHGFIQIQKEIYSPEEFCVSRILEDGDAIELHVCSPICGNDPRRPCIRKCCEVGQMLDLSSYDEEGKLNCMETNGSSVSEQMVTYQMDLHADRHRKLTEEERESLIPHFIVDHPASWCKHSFILLNHQDPNDQSTFRVLADGSVVQKINRLEWHVLKVQDTCIEGSQNYPSHAATASHFYYGDDKNLVVLDCSEQIELQLEDEENRQETGFLRILYPVMMGIASVFLLLTLCRFLVFWRKESVHGWSLGAYVLSLFLQYVFLIAAHVYAHEGTFCLLIGICVHYFFLSTFSWLTIINFDVWWTLWSFTPLSNRTSEIIRFACYTAFGLGVPTVIVTVGLVLQHVYGSDQDSEVIVPDYGKISCFLEPKYAQLRYLYGPLAVLLGCNLLFFLALIYSLYRNKYFSSRSGPGSGLKSQTIMQRFRFFAKLIVVAGVTWLFEVISWACTEENAAVAWYWVVFDLINMLQAVAIFVIFVCTPQTWIAITSFFKCAKIADCADSVNVPGNSGLGRDGNRKSSVAHISLDEITGNNNGS